MNKKFLVFTIILISIYIMIMAVNAENISNTKDVKYYFDNIEPFNENLPREGISQEVIIRGKLVKVEFKGACKKSPCFTIEGFALQDINNEKYKISIYETDPIVKRLEIGKIYIFKGKLIKEADFGRRIVYITHFSIRRILNNQIQNKEVGYDF